MEVDLSDDFLQIATRHANEAVYLRTLTSALSTGSHYFLDGMLAHAVAQEKAARAMVIAWKPSSNLEAQSKLLYLVQYLIVMKTSLDNQEMDAIVNSISHLRQRKRI